MIQAYKKMYAIKAVNVPHEFWIPKGTAGKRTQKTALHNKCLLQIELCSKTMEGR